MYYKRAVAGLVVAACGHATQSRSVIANHEPAAIDAAPAEIDAAGDDCARGDTADLHVAGKTAVARIDLCTIGEEHHGPDITTHDVRAVLVLDRGDGAPVEFELATYESGGEDGLKLSLAGALAAPGGEQVVLVESDGFGPGDGLLGLGAALEVFAVRGDAWEKVHEVDSNVLSVKVSADGEVATVDSCDAIDPNDPNAAGDSLGACSGNPAGPGRGKTRELRWDGQAIDDRDVTPAP